MEISESLNLLYVRNFEDIAIFASFKNFVVSRRYSFEVQNNLTLLLRP